jgi:hypothetical protein
VEPVSAGTAGTTYRAELTFPPGLELTRIAITDPDGKTVASGEWRPESTDSPATWDAAVAKLRFRRIGSRWLPTGAGFATDVVRIRPYESERSDQAESDQVEPLVEEAGQ